MRIDGRPPRAILVIWRLTLIGALIGLPVGLWEAGRLYFVPERPLLVPDVGSVIWFLAPLVDMCIGAVLGAACGLLVATSFEAHPKVSRWVSAALGLLAVLVSLGTVLLLGQVRAGTLPLHAWGCWLGGILFCIGARLGRRRVCALLESELIFRRQRALSMAVVTGLLVMIAGVSAFEFEPYLAASSVRASTRTSAGKPNIVLITLDTVRADHLSLYGYSRPTSPHLDGWARQGVVFDDAISASSWTLASHASMFTGLLPHQHGANWQDPVDTSRWTLAEVLRAYGYETAGFAANTYLEAGWGMSQGFQAYDDVSAFGRHNLSDTWAGKQVLQPWYYDLVQPDHFDRVEASDLNSRVVSWYQRRSGQPFFLFVNYFDAHGPYLSPPPFDRRFGRISKELVTKAHVMIDSAGLAVPLSGEERRSVIDGYDDGLAHLD